MTATPALDTLMATAAAPPARRGRGKSQKSLELIQAAREILAEIQPATIRAVCYRLFVRRLIPNMSKGSTNRVSTQLVYARERGLIPWSWVVDETRAAERIPSWDDPSDYAETIQRAYRRDRWAQQPIRIEVWSEKGTVRGTLAPVLNAYGVTFRVMHGYASATTIHQVAAESRTSDKPFLAFYAGDWDPSGLHMSAVDLPGRLEEQGGRVTLRRVALREFDMEAYQLPSFPLNSKRQDPRHDWYARRFSRFAGRCWELDALSPVVLRDRVKRAIAERIDRAAWERCEQVEQAERASLLTVLGTWKEARG